LVSKINLGPVTCDNYISLVIWLFHCYRKLLFQFVVLAAGQQPVGAASDFGQPAQHGFVQSAGHAFASLAQHGLAQSTGHSFAALTALQGLEESCGQVFAAEPHSVFCGHSALAFSTGQPFAAGQQLLDFTCGFVLVLADKMFV
jgi:hypothetical protein